MRRGLASVSPSATQTRASCASNSSGVAELHRLRGHHRQLQLGGQGHRGTHVGLVRGQPGALQLDVETPRIQRCKPLRQRDRALAVAGQQRRTHRAAVSARQRDQPFGALGQPLPLDPRLCALHVAGPGARQQVAQVVIARRVAHQQQQPRCLLVAAAGGRLDPQIDADDRLDALGAAGLVELDGAEQVAKVGDGQRHLRIVARGTHGIGHPQRAVDNRVLGVCAQVDESHAVNCRQRRRSRGFYNRLMSGSRHGAALARIGP